MGYERFSSMDYTSYSTTTKLSSLRQEEVFKSRNMPQSLDPSKITLRESCDSEINPNSTPVILGLDVTGSMGFVAEAIAKSELATLMQAVYDEKPISDPHLMFMGIGDINCDQAPLQVSQFEAGAIALIEQLREMWLEKGGGGNSFESYDLPWYFAANRTAIDCFNKRGEKGFIITIGDEMPPPRGLDASYLQMVFGTKNLPSAGSTAELLAKAQEKFKVFHIIAEEGSYARSNKREVRNAWGQLLGPNCIHMRDCTKLSAIVVAMLKIANGADMNSVIESSNCSDDLRYAFSNALGD